MLQPVLSVLFQYCILKFYYNSILLHFVHYEKKSLYRNWNIGYLEPLNGLRLSEQFTCVYTNIGDYGHDGWFYKASAETVGFVPNS